MSDPIQQPPAKTGVRTQRSKRTRTLILVSLICGALVVALTTGLVLHFRNKTNEEVQHRQDVIVDCLPELRRQPEKMENSETQCQFKGCLWRRQADEGAPWCYYPSNHGYRTTGNIQASTTGYRVGLQQMDATAVEDNSFSHLDVEVTRQTTNRLRIKISPKDKYRFEVSPDALNIEKSSDLFVNETSAAYKITFTESPFGIAVTRKDSGVVVLNTSLPGLVLSDQFLQMSVRISNENLFGFGEHRHQSIRHDMRWKRWSMFTRDSGPNSDWNLYGHQPVYMNVEDDGKANMLLLKNSNAMEVVLQPHPEPAITYKTTGGVLDFYLFLGDSPKHVVSLYQQAVGLPMFPPYWSLGYHLCRWGYEDINDMRSVILRNRAAEIPYDGQWGDFDTFIKAFVFTYDKTKWKNFPALVDDLRANGQHFITILDPGIGVDENVTREVQSIYPEYDVFGSGETLGVFVRNADNGTLLGEVWPGVTAYPDFTNPETQDWWTRWIRFYIEHVGVKVDALWIDMNEPTSFARGSIEGCRRNKWNFPPYVPDVDGSRADGALFDKTICMDGQQYWGRHYDVHSLYAHSMAMQTYRALESVYPGKRPWVMTRSSYAGTGRFATKWQGDNRATWDDMHYSIISLMEFNMFGFPMNGADICGFWLNTTFELCVRWHQLGAFYPFSRNHNGRGDDNSYKFRHQDPASFGQTFVDLVKPALMTRYRFLPYLYTLLYDAHTEGASVFQPLFFEFPGDSQAMNIDQQFMLGPAFLVTPVLKQGARSVTGYFPDGLWYDYLTGETTKPGTRTLVTPLEKFNLHVRAGHVIPWQEPDVGELIITPEIQGLASRLKFDTLEIFGLDFLPSWLKVNDIQVPTANISLVHRNVVQCTGLGLPMTSSSTIAWSSY
ncbi:sucrase-isomaltase, intestinal-like [Plakobranchus ocellatus]|uniref:alpha-glucosidase n=1 Tax=Plakobranchus ocellatus TaxID=259542 RepID=A0AAV4BBP9_9GAST|nr:sucrase-isomaltase, intestinal-like [Plakobranchus ocellatus]